jgi:hypothetical protein
MTKIYPLKQALITGIVSGVFAVSAFAIFTGLSDGLGKQINPVTIRWLTGLFSLLILAVGVYSGIQSVKRSNGAKLSYGQAVGAGVLVGLTVGICMAIIGLIYTNIINPGYHDYMLAENKKEMLAAGNSSADITAAQANLAKMLTPGVQIMQALVLQTGVATILSLIMGLFLRSRD